MDDVTEYFVRELFCFVGLFLEFVRTEPLLLLLLLQRQGQTNSEKGCILRRKHVVRRGGNGESKVRREGMDKVRCYRMAETSSYKKRQSKKVQHQGRYGKMDFV